MPKLREVVLPRWHSGRWLLSPDLLRAYDRVWMHPDDATATEEESGLSTYNAWEAENLRAIRNVDNLLNVKIHPAHVNPSEKEIERVAEDIIQLPSMFKTIPLVISPVRLKVAVIHAHQWCFPSICQ